MLTFEMALHCDSYGGQHDFHLIWPCTDRWLLETKSTWSREGIKDWVSGRVVEFEGGRRLGCSLEGGWTSRFRTRALSYDSCFGHVDVLQLIWQNWIPETWSTEQERSFVKVYAHGPDVRQEEKILWERVQCGSCRKHFPASLFLPNSFTTKR